MSAPADDWLARVYDTVGGNPLALKLVAGQAASLPLERIVENLRSARGAPAEQLWRAIYQQSWNLVTDAARKRSSRSPRSRRVERRTRNYPSPPLRALTLDAALAQLVAHSLVFFDGARYTLHRLTHMFLLQKEGRKMNDEG